MKQMFARTRTKNKRSFKGNKQTVLALGAATLFGLSGFEASAKQYIVKMRSPESFHKVETEYKEFLQEHSSRTHSTSLWGYSALANAPRIEDTDLRVVETLDQLNMVIVEGPDNLNLQSLTDHQDVEYYSEDFMYPLPMNPLPGDSSSRKSRKIDPNSSEITWGLKAVKALEAWEELEAARKKRRSQKIVVTVLDTGIDRNHPDLKAQFGIGEDFVSKGMENIEIPNILDLRLRSQDEEKGADYPYFDTNGHGTHVAGTIAASLNQAGVAGVAPNAKINAARVCGKFGCSDVAIVKAINWAVKNNADVISMSLGGPTGSRSQKEALAAAEKAGVISVAASGNSGTPQVSFPAAFDSVISVGAVDSALNKATFSQWGKELDVVAPGVDVISSVPQGSGRESLVKVGETTLEQVTSSSFVGALESFEPVEGNLVTAGLGRPEDFVSTKVFENRIVLIQRGEIPFADKVKNAIKAKAKAVLIYNNTSGLLSGALTQDGSTLPITAAMIEQNVGEDLARKIDILQKPVKASLKIAKTDYAAFQGTSMATPHVSGVVALILSANPKLNTKQVRDLLKSTAFKLESCNNNENQCGAGLVNSLAAVKKAKTLKEINQNNSWGVATP